MKKSISITTSFLDVGGVLLTDGWSHGSRKLAAKAFDLNPEEMGNRHNQAFDTYELGELAVGGRHGRPRQDRPEHHGG